MSEEPEKPFADSWAQLGASVEIAGLISTLDHAQVVGLITMARKASGTEGERGALAALHAVRSAARAQAELADAAIEIVETCVKLANEAALAEVVPSEAAFQTAGTA